MFRQNHTNVGGEALPVTISATPLVGYRLWRVVVQEGFLLRSIHTAYTWEHENTAVCLAIGTGGAMFRDRNHHSPNIDCSCGLYASLPEHPLGEWVNMVRGRVHASGTVAMHGTIIRCDLGFKAEHATVQSPVVLESECMDSECESEVTGVNTTVTGEYTCYCDEHAPGPIIDAAKFMAQASEALSESLGVEVISYHLL